MKAPSVIGRSVYLLGGVIISILGIIGIYLGAFDETKCRPLYIVRAATGLQPYGD